MDDHELRALLRHALDRAQASALSTLDAEIDVKQCLRDAYRQAGLDPGLAEQTDDTDRRLNNR